MLWKMVTGEDAGRVTWMDAGSIHGSHKSKQRQTEQRERNGDVFTERELEGSNATDEHREKLKKNIQLIFPLP